MPGSASFQRGAEILVGDFFLGLVSRQRERSAELQVRRGADGIADNGPAMIENLLEFHGGIGALVCGQIGQATHIEGIERPRSYHVCCAAFIGNGGL
jgi:hypothetical protein